MTLLRLPAGPVEPADFSVYTVTPGIAGFVWFLILAVAAWLLFRSLVRHMRRLDHNARMRERAASDHEPREGGAAAGTSSGGRAEAGRSPEPGAGPDQAAR